MEVAAPTKERVSSKVSTGLFRTSLLGFMFWTNSLHLQNASGNIQSGRKAIASLPFAVYLNIIALY
jgi:hypothetical protein